MTAKRRRTRRSATGFEDIAKPQMIEDYNRYMGGVDLSDQMIQPYGYSHRYTQNFNKYITFVVTGH